MIALGVYGGAVLGGIRELFRITELTPVAARLPRTPKSAIPAAGQAIVPPPATAGRCVPPRKVPATAAPSVWARCRSVTRPAWVRADTSTSAYGVTK